jgi:hypothetical protein
MGTGEISIIKTDIFDFLQLTLFMPGGESCRLREKLGN